MLQQHYEAARAVASRRAWAVLTSAMVLLFRHTLERFAALLLVHELARVGVALGVVVVYRVSALGPILDRTLPMTLTSVCSHVRVTSLTSVDAARSGAAQLHPQ